MGVCIGGTPLMYAGGLDMNIGFGCLASAILWDS